MIISKTSFVLLKMPQNLYKKILIALLLIVGVLGIIRTNTIQRSAGSGDFRNRVQGARLMKDGIIPYYYHWHPGDPVRYVSEHDIDTSHRRRVSMCTSSPLFHRVLGPFADYNEPVIDRGIFILFYAFLVIMALLTWYKSKNLLLTLLFFVPFLFSDGWCHHITLVQNYFLFGFLFFLVSFTILKKHYFFAGLLFALLFLFRLNSIVFAIPFILLFRQYKHFILGLASGLLIYVSILAFFPFERKNWTEYFSALQEHTKVHLGQLPHEQRYYNIDSLLPFPFEGENFAAMEIKRQHTPSTWVNPEASNFSLIYKFILKRQPPVLLLNGLLGFCYLSVIAAFFFVKRKQKDYNISIEQVLLTGLLFYGLSCFFSPIISNPYQMPQWMTVAALIIIFNRKIPRWLIVFFFLGIFVDLVYFPNIRGKHAISDVIFMFSTFLIIIKSDWNKNIDSNLR
ncbi:DUF2029 domain-containing protein [Taibaiella lutea]|uniref:DUF2029 domain-containing protein n=1 Tax=Taibaiella lutea TaxID=2608001 RepID=A0A5M6CM33_9BACT|nr:glycosyltransferase 87 family protein [Taibaiella lutea]KAA5536113.1 DUF2029 domain-containing protein [Taibaiella lutea]